MSGAGKPVRAKRNILWIFLGIVVGAAMTLAWIVFAPGPTDFAGGHPVTLAEYQDSDPTGVPPELRQTSVVERGECLARAADCVVCHTATGGEPFAGGLGFRLPFGTMYSTNITPDTETGIGKYTDAEFLDAVHKGIGRGKRRLYPAMPYASYAYMTDADALAIKAYLFSLKPVRATPPQNTLEFPFNQRGLMAVWSALFNPDERFRPRAERSPEWNRGAYLAEALGHCGECHTPRNLFQALNSRHKFAGTVQAVGGLTISRPITAVAWATGAMPTSCTICP
jgi:mono/diheme cytochrome c family protein